MLRVTQDKREYLNRSLTRKDIKQSFKTFPLKNAHDHMAVLIKSIKYLKKN